MAPTLIYSQIIDYLWCFQSRFVLIPILNPEVSTYRSLLFWKAQALLKRIPRVQTKTKTTVPSGSPVGRDFLHSPPDRNVSLMFKMICIVLYQSPCHFILFFFSILCFLCVFFHFVGVHTHAFGCPSSSSSCMFSPSADLLCCTAHLFSPPLPPCGVKPKERLGPVAKYCHLLAAGNVFLICPSVQ